MIVTSPGNSLLRRTVKTLTFTGGAGLGAVGAVPLMTVTGAVNVSLITGFVTTDLTVAAGATLALGVTGSTSKFIAATDASTLLTTAPIWLSTTATAAALAIPAACKDIMIAANIIGTVGVDAISAGVMVFVVYWLPLTNDGNLV